MKEFLIMTLIIGVVFGVSFIMINIRQILTGKDFRGTCASNNSALTDKVGDCEMCGKKPEEQCQMPEVHA